MRYDKLISKTLDVRLYSGDEAYCLCPFHDDANPSFAINRETGLWICHGCGKKGNSARLGAELGGEVPSATVEDITEKIDALLHPPEDLELPVLPETWLAQFMADQGYWAGRKFSPATIYSWGLGYDPITSYATIPLHRWNGDLIGVIRRATRDDQKPRYVYPSGFHAGQEMFGAHRLGPYNESVCLVEGPLDVISCWKAGIPALGCYGASISLSQVQLLRRLGVYNVVLLTDNDVVGRKARETMAEVLEGFLVSVPRFWPENRKDPGEMSPKALNRVLRESRLLTLSIR